MLDPETEAYLDGPWTIGSRTLLSGHVVAVIYGPDGDPILTCDSWNSAHLLQPADVAEYIVRMHEDRRRTGTPRDQAISDADHWQETPSLPLRMSLELWLRERAARRGKT